MQDVINTLWSILWILRNILLEYLMKFNTVSLYWHNLKFSIIIIFWRLLHSTYTTWNSQLKADYQSHLIKLALMYLKQSSFRKFRLHYTD